MAYPYNYGYPQPQQQPAFNCRPVTSQEEAIAAQTDFFNAGTVMPDIAHGKIYLKRFNQQTGASEFMVFTYTPPEQPKPAPEYATIEMLNDLERRLTANE